MTWTHYKVTNKSSDSYKVEVMYIDLDTLQRDQQVRNNYKVEGTLY